MRSVTSRLALTSCYASLLLACGSGEDGGMDDPMGMLPAASGNPAPGAELPANDAPADGNGEQAPPAAGGDLGAPGVADPQEGAVAGPNNSAAATGASQLGVAEMSGMGSSSDQFAEADVTRNGKNYFFMANGWGPGFESQSVSWNGTSFTVEAMEGRVGDNYEPASYPTVFCGQYSNNESKECGLPRPLSEITSMRTGWRWAPNGNIGQYNAAYDIWLGRSGGGFAGFAMIWLRDPVGQQPAGSRVEVDVTVADIPGTWDIWEGTVYGSVPIINWVRGQDEDSTELEFDIMDFVRDAQQRGYDLPGDVVNAVAVGFEIWKGPVTNLQSLDFYVDVE